MWQKEIFEELGFLGRGISVSLRKLVESTLAQQIYNIFRNCGIICHLHYNLAWIWMKWTVSQFLSRAHLTFGADMGTGIA